MDFRISELLVLRQIADVLVGAQHHQLHAIGHEGLEDVVTIGEHPADGLIGMEQSLIARLASDDRELTGPGELRVVRIDLELGRRGDHVRLLLEPAVTPVLLGAQVERRSAQLVAHRVVGLELLAMPDGPMVPVVDAIAVEVRLGDLGPVLAGIGAGVGVVVESLLAGVLVGGVLRSRQVGSIWASVPSIVWQNSWTPMLSSS